MSTEALRSAVEADGRARIEAILRDAQAEASRIRSDAESLSTGRQEEVLRAEETRLRREGNRRIAAARGEARECALEARDAFLERVFAAAREALPRALDRPEAIAQLTARIGRALAHMPDGPVVVSCSRDVAPILEAAVAERDDVRVEADPALAFGFRATSEDGRLVVDASFASLLEMDRAALAIEILHQLDDEAPGREGV